MHQHHSSILRRELIYWLSAIYPPFLNLSAQKWSQRSYPTGVQSVAIAGALFLVLLVPSAIVTEHFMYRWLGWYYTPGSPNDAETIALGIALFIWLIVPLVISRALYTKLRWKLIRQEELCPVCSYSLVGNTSGICPECGTSVAAAPAMPRTARLVGYPRQRLVAATVMAGCAGILALFLLPNAFSSPLNVHSLLLVVVAIAASAWVLAYAVLSRRVRNGDAAECH